jgi:hypothetical protein
LDRKRDDLGDPRAEAVLVHYKLPLSRDARDLLDWCLTDCDIRLITENLVGSAWMQPPEGREQ